MNNVKSNKSSTNLAVRKLTNPTWRNYVVLYDDFDPIRDIFCLKLSLVEENMTKLQNNLKKHLTCFKLKIDGKLEKNELCKFIFNGIEGFRYC